MREAHRAALCLAHHLAVLVWHVLREGRQHRGKLGGAHLDLQKGVAQRQDARHCAARAAQAPSHLPLQQCDLRSDVLLVQREVGQRAVGATERLKRRELRAKRLHLR